MLVYEYRIFVNFVIFPCSYGYQDIKLIREVEKTVNWIRFKNGLNILEYGRFRKEGDIVSYKFQLGNIIQIADYAFLFDMMMFLCDRSNLLPYKYILKLALKLNDHILDGLKDIPDRYNKS